jgi:hypothetical protein
VRTPSTSRKPKVVAAAPVESDLRLYVAGPTPKSIAAFRNLEQAPIRKIIGNLSDTERVLVGLDLRPRESDPFAPGKGKKHG